MENTTYQELNTDRSIGNRMGMICKWENLPEVALGTIFSDLGLFDKLHVREVCLSWKQGLARPEVWHSFAYSDDYVWNELIRVETSVSSLKKFNKVKQDILQCVRDYGRYFQEVYVHFGGATSFDIFQEIRNYCVNLTSIHLNRSRIVELPGDFRQHMHELMFKNWKLQHICIEDVTLKPISNNDPLPIGLRHSQKLKTLSLVNSFPGYSLSSLMYLVNLCELTINPHNLHHSLINHLASLSLRKLTIVANRQTKEFFFENLSEQQWQDLAVHKNLRVHCYMGVSYDWAEKATLLKPNIPMVTVLYKKSTWLHYERLSNLLANYRETLEVFVDYSVHEGSYQNAGSFRQDRHIIKIAQACSNIHTLAVKEKLCSSSILLIVSLCRNLKHFYVRDDMVVYEFDVPEDIVVAPEVMNLILNSWSEDKFTSAVSELMGKPWRLMNRMEYMNTLQTKYGTYV